MARKAIRTKGFRSKGESNCYDYLTLLEKSGEISHLESQPKAVLLTRAKISYRADFKFFNERTGVWIWAEYKPTSLWGKNKGKLFLHNGRFLIIKKLWEEYGPGPLRIYTGYGRAIQLVDTILP